MTTPRTAQRTLASISAYLSRPHPERAVLARQLRRLAEQVEAPLVRQASLRTAAAMPEHEFWSIVDSIGWGTKTVNYKQIQKQLMRQLSPEQAGAFRETFQTLKHKLDPVVDKAIRSRDVWVGDDGFDDLLSHIIGLGKHEYDAVMRNPNLAADRAESRKYKESFAYAIPHAEDYKQLDVKPHLEWATKIIRVYEQVLSADEDDIPWLPKLGRPMQQVIGIMQDFIRTKDPHAFLAQEAEAKQASELVEGILSRLSMGGMGLMEEGTIEDAVQTAKNKWFVWNLFSDVRQYLT